LAKIDEVKEEIGYLKFWLGIIVATDMGLIGWLVNNYNKSFYKSIVVIVSIFVLTIIIGVMNKKTKSKIKELREL